MKIFISHASVNKEYGDALVDLLRGVGVNEDEIIFTSNIAYGIPIGKNIFNWLKSQISEKPFVVYLLSKEYYSSIACLNEMGAAWIVENEHAILFTPDFDLNSKEFQNGAIDPREIGFYIDNEERVFSFLQHLEKHFNISKNNVILHQKVKQYVNDINTIKNKKKAVVTEKQAASPIIQTSKDDIKKETSNKVQLSSKTAEIKFEASNEGIYSKFIREIQEGKLKDEELILLNYIIETSRIKLGTGWQEPGEVQNINDWEEINDIKNTLSVNYGNAIRKFELRGYTEVSARTSSGNPKEITLKSELSKHILDLPSEILEIINNVKDKNKGRQTSNKFDIPF